MWSRQHLGLSFLTEKKSVRLAQNPHKCTSLSLCQPLPNSTSGYISNHSFLFSIEPVPTALAPVSIIVVLGPWGLKWARLRFFLAIPSIDQGLLLTGLGESYVVLGIKSGWPLYKASVILTLLLLQPLWYGFYRASVLISLFSLQP